MVSVATFFFPKKKKKKKHSVITSMYHKVINKMGVHPEPLRLHNLRVVIVAEPRS